MKLPPDFAAIVRVFAEVPVLTGAGVLAGATARDHEHLGNRLSRLSFDIDFRCEELPVKRPLPPDELCGFAEALAHANSRVAQALLT